MTFIVKYRPKIFSKDLPREILQLIYEYDSTYLDYFREHVIPSLMEKVWIRIFCRIEGLSHQFILRGDTALSLWYYTHNEDDWAEVSDFEDEGEEDEDEDF